MSEHYTRNTSGVLKFCNTCNKMTIYKVSNKRLGTCSEVHVIGKSEKQKKQEEVQIAEPTLF